MKWVWGRFLLIILDIPLNKKFPDMLFKKEKPGIGISSS